MSYEPIRKDVGAMARRPNVTEYRSFYRDFRWSDAQGLLSGMTDGGINMAYEAVERHATGASAERIALRWLGEDGDRIDISFAELNRQANRFASVLRSLGIQRGDVVFLLLERIPELYYAVLGAWKAGCVVSALFSAFGPDPVATRVGIGDGRLLVTTLDHYTYKIQKIRSELPGLQHVLLAGEDCDSPVEGAADLQALMRQANESFRTESMQHEDMALLHFTSGTTGKPKGAVHVHGAVLAHTATGRHALDLQEDDVFWCTADPGWVTGISYGLVSPLSNGVTMVVDEADFDIERWYEIVQREKVTVWYTAPTAIRMMMKAGLDVARAFDFSSLRLIFSVGEPLNAEAVVWGQKAFGLPIHDTWWQTETGCIMISNFACEEIRPGSMGLAVPGVEASIVRRLEDGSVAAIDEPGQEGEIALKKGWPSMFRGYLHDESRYLEAFRGDLYLTGDLARRDADGYFWFVGRADDVIKSSGHLIGPFEVESALMEHPAVAEAGVIGIPDEMAGQIVKAFVSLRAGFAATDDLRQEIYAFGRKRLGGVAPREIEIRDSLPKTRSGKIMRRLLKARELGLPEGDTSTLEASK